MMNQDRTPDAVKQRFRATVGKTVKSVDVRTNPGRFKNVHTDERLTIEFTDGSHLVVVIGSNGDELTEKYRGFTNRELDLSFQPMLFAPGEPLPKRL